MHAIARRRGVAGPERALDRRRGGDELRRRPGRDLSVRGRDRPLGRLLVRDRIGPVAAFKTATVVARLPKTRSGKILRGTMRRIADGEDYTIPATIDDPAVLDEIGGALGAIGYPRAGAAAR